MFRGGIDFVRVDVIVSDKKAQPVTNLTETDFEVLEDGKPVKIEQFRLIKVDGNAKPGGPPPKQIRNRNDEELEAARDDVRIFVFFMDDYHVRRGNSMSVRSRSPGSSSSSCGRPTWSGSCIRCSRCPICS